MPNAFHRRAAERLLKKQAARQNNRELKMVENNHIMKSYEDAWLELHRVPCRVSHENGWYYVHARKIRQTVLIGLTNQLLAKLHEKELDHEDA